MEWFIVVWSLQTNSLREITTQHFATKDACEIMLVHQSRDWLQMRVNGQLKNTGNYVTRVCMQINPSDMPGTPTPATPTGGFKS